MVFVTVQAQFRGMTLSACSFRNKESPSFKSYVIAYHSLVYVKPSAGNLQLKRASLGFQCQTWSAHSIMY